MLSFGRWRAASGSVLLAVLCLLAVLSFLIITTAAMSRKHGEMQQARAGMLRARQLAEAGIAVGVHPLIKVGDPLLRQRVSGMESFGVQLTTEERKLNLNALLTAERLPLLERVLESWGLARVDAEDIAASLMDWTDADDLKRRPGSAEKADYEFLGKPGLPLNRPFVSLDEVEMVARMDEVREAMPGWREWFTLRGEGRLDVNTASAEMLAAVTGASLEKAQQLVSARHGPDGLPQTEDDAPLKSLEEAMALLGIYGGGSANLRPLLTLQGATRHIASIGRAGDMRCGIALVASFTEGASAPRMVEWSEFAVEGAGLP